MNTQNTNPIIIDKKILNHIMDIAIDVQQEYVFRNYERRYLQLIILLIAFDKFLATRGINNLFELKIDL